MEVKLTQQALRDVNEDAIVLLVFEGDTPDKGSLARLNEVTENAVAKLFESREVDGKRDRWALLYSDGKIEARRVLLYGAGKREEADIVTLQRVVGTAIRMLAERNIKSAAFLLNEKIGAPAQAQSIVEGAMLGHLDTAIYASGKEASEFERISILCGEDNIAELESAIRIGQVFAQSVNLARNLGNEPSNVMTPSELALRAEEMAAREGLSFEAMEEDQMKHLGMGALLGVSRGSAEPARLIVIGYNLESDAAANGETIALIGKGITFDSGGISIKPATRMDEMKFDMGGGAAVIGAMQAIARLRPAASVIGVIPASENLPSGRALKPGDVLRSLSGKTIEVIDTDAEGRLVLADAITYAIGRGAKCIIDAATLTGACVVALGDVRAGVIGTDQKLIDSLIAVGDDCGERIWQLPLDKDYGLLMRSDIADMKNVGNRTAGAITAASFLKHFTGDIPWAHLDIAGTAWLEEAKPYMAKGATGFGTRLMASYVLRKSGQ
jgi:leucyl aminopeptidase